MYLLNWRNHGGLWQKVNAVVYYLVYFFQFFYYYIFFNFFIIIFFSWKFLNFYRSHHMAHCIVTHFSCTYMDNHKVGTNPFCLGRNQFKSLSCHQSKFFFKHYIQFFCVTFFFHLSFRQLSSMVNWKKTLQVAWSIPKMLPRQCTHH